MYLFINPINHIYNRSVNMPSRFAILNSIFIGFDNTSFYSIAIFISCIFLLRSQNFYVWYVFLFLSFIKIMMINYLLWINNIYKNKGHFFLLIFNCPQLFASQVNMYMGSCIVSVCVCVYVCACARARGWLPCFARLPTDFESHTD